MIKIAKKPDTPKKPMKEIIEKLRKPPKPSGKTYIKGIIKEQKEFKKLDKSHKKNPKHKKYAEMVSFKNPTQARISARKLRKEFREAKQNAKKQRIARATQDASNRAKAIGKIYDTTAKSMWEKYKHKKKSAFPKEVLKARSEGRAILTKEGKRKRTFYVATNGKKSKK